MVPEWAPPAHWHSRGYLPHFDVPGLVQGVTFRLADAVPLHVITAWRDELDARRPRLAETRRARGLRSLIARFEDTGWGACVLRDRRAARVVEAALLRFDGERHPLIAWCVMPSHVHVLIETLPGVSLARVVHGWKSCSAHEINAVLGRTGRLWMPDYFDRYIRNARQFAAAVVYIHANPVTAGLVRRAEDWEFSSARRGEMSRWNLRARHPRSNPRGGPRKATMGAARIAAVSAAPTLRDASRRAVRARRPRSGPISPTPPSPPPRSARTPPPPARRRARAG